MSLRQKFDIGSLKDPRPAISELFKIIRSFSRKARESMPFLGDDDG